MILQTPKLYPRRYTKWSIRVFKTSSYLSQYNLQLVDTIHCR